MGHELVSCYSSNEVASNDTCFSSAAVLLCALLYVMFIVHFCTLCSLCTPVPYVHCALPVPYVHRALLYLMFIVPAQLSHLVEAETHGMTPSFCQLQALYVVAVTVLFPGSILALAAGAVCGLVLGSLLVWLGTVLGQTLAFIIGR